MRSARMSYVCPTFCGTCRARSPDRTPAPASPVQPLAPPSRVGFDEKVLSCSPKFTEGSPKALIAANGITSRDGRPVELQRHRDEIVLRRSRSQNWCCRTMVISSGYLARSSGDISTPSAAVAKVR